MASRDNLGGRLSQWQGLICEWCSQRRWPNRTASAKHPAVRSLRSVLAHEHQQSAASSLITLGRAVWPPSRGGPPTKLSTNTTKCQQAQRTPVRTHKHKACDMNSSSAWTPVVLTMVLFCLPSICAGRVILGETHEVAGYNMPYHHENPASASSTLTEVNFLSTFGYLPQSDQETEALRTGEELERAIRKLQRFAQLPVTGRLDEATRTVMETPRCGLPDFEPEENNVDRRSRRYVIGPSKWDKNGLTFRILNYTPDLRQVEIEDSVNRAFRVWSEVTYLNFRQVFSGYADIMIRFARGYHMDGYPFDGEGMILAHAFFPGEDRGGDVHFDDDELWTYNAYEGTNLFMVAAHEIGHALGLSHSSVLGSLMYPWYQGFIPNFQLHTDDIAAIQYIYGYRQDPLDPSALPTMPPPGGDNSTGGFKPYTQRPETPTTTTTTVAPPRGRTTTRPDREGPAVDGPPDPCRSGLDAISVIRGEVFAFKGKWFWRINENGLVAGYPVKTSTFFYGLPEDVSKVDAVYERRDGTHIFFAGKHYWVFHGNNLRYSLPLTKLGFPDDVTHIDAVFVWGYNRRTYMVSGHMYWRFNEETNMVEDNYPRDMSMWAGVQVPVDGALNYWDGHTYFFSGGDYWRFNDNRMRVYGEGYPKDVGINWLGCVPSSDRVVQDEDMPGAAAPGISQANAALLAMSLILVAMYLP